MYGSNLLNLIILMGSEIRRLWMFNLWKWNATFMLLRLGNTQPGTCLILSKGLCFNTVEDGEARGREISWLHMGILPLLKSNNFWA
jgi:hypothetical protein